MTNSRKELSFSGHTHTEYASYNHTHSEYVTNSYLNNQIAIINDNISKLSETIQGANGEAFSYTSSIAYSESMWDYSAQYNLNMDFDVSYVIIHIGSWATGNCMISGSNIGGQTTYIGGGTVTNTSELTISNGSSGTFLGSITVESSNNWSDSKTVSAGLQIELNSNILIIRNSGFYIDQYANNVQFSISGTAHG